MLSQVDQTCSLPHNLACFVFLGDLAIVDLHAFGHCAGERESGVDHHALHREANDAPRQKEAAPVWIE